MLRYPRRVGTLLIVSFTGEGKFPHSELLRYPRRVGTDPIVSFTGEGKFVTLPQKGWDTPHSELYRGGEICYVTPEGLGQTL